MIAFLRGALHSKHPGQAIVDVQGVGYDVIIPVSTYTALSDADKEVRLHIHTNVREDAIQLFGFITLDEKHLFEKLITVNGVGPKLAITALSGLAIPDLIAAIRGGDVVRLTRIPGVGKKTAERIVLELRDKLDLSPLPDTPGKPAAGPSMNSLEQDVVSALINLGSTRPAAEEAVRKARSSVSGDQFEALFRKALELAR